MIVTLCEKGTLNVMHPIQWEFTNEKVSFYESTDKVLLGRNYIDGSGFDPDLN